jgi:hypothetical protein
MITDDSLDNFCARAWVLEEWRRFWLMNPTLFPRSQILFGNAGFDALHHTSCTLHSKGAGIPNFEVGNEKLTPILRKIARCWAIVT